MKTIIIITSSIILSVVAVFFCFYFVLTPPEYIGEFSVSAFRDEIENVNLKTDKNYGTIKDYEAAAKAAKTAISERFETSTGNIFDWTACEVQFDPDNEAYYVYIYDMFPQMKGGAYGMIIKSDGTVLAIWGEK